MRAAIWRNTILAALLYVVAIALAEQLLRDHVTGGRDVSFAVAFAAVQMVAIFIMVIALFARKRWTTVRAARSRRLVPEIQDALALHAVGLDQRRRLEEFHRQAPHDVRETLFGMLAATRGPARERVASLASDLGLAEHERQEAIEWVRNIVRIRHAESVAQVVGVVAHQSLLVRAIAAEELAPFAAEIAEAEIERLLESPDPDVIVMALDMIRAWRRARQVPGFPRLLRHGDVRVRTRALLSLPYVAAGAPPDSLSAVLIGALRDEDPEVRAAAATAAGRLGVTGAADALAGRLADPRREVAVAAAFALAGLGERGDALLQKAVLSTDRGAASVAFEAHEKSALGRAELV